MVLALYTPKLKDMEMFKTRNVPVLAYLLALTMGMCVTMYITAVQLELSIKCANSSLVVWLEAMVFLCIICLFVPPLLPVLKEYRLFMCHSNPASKYNFFTSIILSLASSFVTRHLLPLCLRVSGCLPIKGSGACFGSFAK